MGNMELWLAFGKRRGTDPRHWMLILREPAGINGTWYHVTGGKGVYELEILSGKRFRSHGISEHHFICQFDEKDRNKLKASCQSTPLTRCQEWTTAVLGSLEKKGLVPKGTHSHWFDQIEPSEWSTDGVHGIDKGGSASGSQSSKSSILRTQKTACGQSSNGWVWDASHRRYRHYDEGRRQWIWAK
ncbi:hypothetical protein K449DRAFT_386731 [Hypoxylon sp. EC38]|nr:hypothetical protein K449DRAFT_386731 [Hypoxylon sp. EC38]